MFISHKNDKLYTSHSQEITADDCNLQTAGKATCCIGHWSNTSSRNYCYTTRVPRSEAKTLGWLKSAITTTQVLFMGTAPPIYGMWGKFYFFIVKCGIACFLCTCTHYARTRCWASSSPLGYLCAKFSFCRTLRCWASPQKKIGYSVTQSFIQFIWFAKNQRLRFGREWNATHSREISNV